MLFFMWKGCDILNMRDTHLFSVLGRVVCLTRPATRVDRPRGVVCLTRPVTRVDRPRASRVFISP